MSEPKPYVQPVNLTVEQQFQLASFNDIEAEIMALIETLPMSRSMAVGKTNIEQGLMWVRKGIVHGE